MMRCRPRNPAVAAAFAASVASMVVPSMPEAYRLVPRLVDARDGWRWWRRCPDAGAMPAACRRQLPYPQTLGICSRSRRDDGVVVRSLTPGEGLVRVVRLMLAHGRVVVTMRHGWNGDDAVSPQNGTDGVPSRLTIR